MIVDFGTCDSPSHTAERCMNCGGRNVSTSTLDAIMGSIATRFDLSWLTKSDRWNIALDVIDALTEMGEGPNEVER